MTVMFKAVMPKNVALLKHDLTAINLEVYCLPENGD